MRTSGATSETSMTIVVVVIAFTLLVFFAGGPREFLLAVQRTVEWRGKPRVHDLPAAQGLSPAGDRRSSSSSRRYSTAGGSLGPNVSNACRSLAASAAVGA